MKRVSFVLDSPIHVRATFLAGVTLDGGIGVDDAEFVAILYDADLVARYDAHDREGRAFRFPTFGATASVVVRDLTADEYLDRVLRTFATERAALEIGCSRLHATIDGRMDSDRFGHCVPP